MCLYEYVEYACTEGSEPSKRQEHMTLDRWALCDSAVPFDENKYRPCNAQLGLVTRKKTFKSPQRCPFACNGKNEGYMEAVYEDLGKPEPVGGYFGDELHKEGDAGMPPMLSSRHYVLSNVVYREIRETGWSPQLTRFSENT